MKPDPVLVQQFQAALEPIAAERGWPPKRLLARQARRVRRLRRDGWLAALDRAVGRSVRRKRAAANLLTELTDLPEVADRFTAWLTDPDLAWRAEVIVLVGQRGLSQFAPLLNDALEGHADDHCRAYAIRAAGELRSEANLPALLDLASNPAFDRLFRRTLWALKDYPHPRFRPALERFFRAGRPKEERVLAAWGLGKLGDPEALRYLVAMLDDPEVETPTSFDPGYSLRAAQALCDIHGWPFRWDRRWVARTKRRWQQSLPRENEG
jgi:HEAT repeat protein